VFGGIHSDAEKRTLVSKRLSMAEDEELREAHMRYAMAALQKRPP
jgi:hypothetical protein